MTKNAPFNAWANNYERNLDVGENLRVVPAKLHHAGGGHDAGIAIFNRQTCFLVITEDHAYKLANMIADVLEGNAA